MRAIRERYDDVRFMIQSRNTPAILDELQAHQLDLDAVGQQPPYTGVDVIAETAAPYVCLLPGDHPLCDADGPLDLEDLTVTETFITTGDAYTDEMMGIDRALFRRLKVRSGISAANLPVVAALVCESGRLPLRTRFRTNRRSAWECRVQANQARAELSYCHCVSGTRPVATNYARLRRGPEPGGR